MSWSHLAMPVFQPFGSHQRRSPRHPWSQTWPMSEPECHTNNVSWTTPYWVYYRVNKTTSLSWVMGWSQHIFLSTYLMIRQWSNRSQDTWGWPSAPSALEPPRQCPDFRKAKVWPFSSKPWSPSLLADVAGRWSLPKSGVALEALRSELTVEELHDQLGQNGALANSQLETGREFSDWKGWIWPLTFERPWVGRRQNRSTDCCRNSECPHHLSMNWLVINLYEMNFYLKAPFWGINMS